MVSKVEVPSQHSHVLHTVHSDGRFVAWRRVDASKQNNNLNQHMFVCLFVHVHSLTLFLTLDSMHSKSTGKISI